MGLFAILKRNSEAAGIDLGNLNAKQGMKNLKDRQKEEKENEKKSQEGSIIVEVDENTAEKSSSDESEYEKKGEEGD